MTAQHTHTHFYFLLPFICRGCSARPPWLAPLPAERSLARGSPLARECSLAHRRGPGPRSGFYLTLRQFPLATLRPASRSRSTRGFARLRHSAVYHPSALAPRLAGLLPAAKPRGNGKVDAYRQECFDFVLRLPERLRASARKVFRPFGSGTPRAIARTAIKDGQ